MINVIKKSKIIPLEWSEMWIKTLKKKKGSYKTLNNCRGIFIVPIISVIFEMLIKNRIMDTLQGTLSHFQNGGMRGKGVADNLFIISVIFEKLIKNRIMDTLQGTLSHFQNGGMRGKGVADNLFILQGIIDYAMYLGKQLWIKFYNIEKCFDSLRPEDCKLLMGKWY